MQQALGPVETRLEFTDNPADPRSFWAVDAFTLDEGLNQLYRLTCELMVPQAHRAHSSTWLGARVRVQMLRARQTRVVFGVVRRIELHDAGREMLVVRLVVMPTVSLLEQQHGHRIYSDKTLTQLLQHILRGPGLESWQAAAAQRKSGEDTSQPAFERLRICIEDSPPMALLQYQESVWAFVERTLAAWGLTFFFVHDEAAPCEQMVIVGDTRREHLGHLGAYPLVASSRELGAQEAIHSLRFGREPQAVIALAAHLPSHGTAIVHAPPTTKGDVDAPQAAQATRYVTVSPAQMLSSTDPARFGSDEPQPTHTSPIASCELFVQRQAETLARRQALLASSMCDGSANILSLAPGHVLDVPAPDGQGTMAVLITAVSHSNSWQDDAAFEQRFDFVPAACAFAAEVPPVPQVGLQLGRIVGPPTDEVHLDAGGRVLVRLAWEQNDSHHHSAGVWAELSHAWAGTRMGAFFYPRIGTQVTVALLDQGAGSPIVAVVMGGCFNEVQRPPYGYNQGRLISGIRTRSAPSALGTRYNELIFDDAWGTERVELRAQHSLRIWAGNDFEQRVGDIYSQARFALEFVRAALDLTEQVDYHRIIARQAAHDNDVAPEAASMGAGPSNSAPPGSEDWLTRLGRWRAEVLLAIELAEALLSMHQDGFVDGLHNGLSRRHMQRLHDSLLKLAASFIEMTPQCRSDVVRAAQLLRIIMVMGSKRQATLATVVTGSRALRVSGPSSERLEGGVRRELGSAQPAAVRALARAGRIALGALRPPTEWLPRFANEGPKRPLVEEVLVHGASKTVIDDDKALDVGGSLRVRSKKLLSIFGRKALQVRARKTLDINSDSKLRLTSGAKLGIAAKSLLTLAGDRIAIKAQHALQLSSKQRLDVQADQQVRVDGRLVTIRGNHSVKLEQGRAAIVLKDGNIHLSGDNIYISGKEMVTVRSTRTHIR